MLAYNVPIKNITLRKQFSKCIDHLNPLSQCRAMFNLPRTMMKCLCVLLGIQTLHWKWEQSFIVWCEKCIPVTSGLDRIWNIPILHDKLMPHAKYTIFQKYVILCFNIHVDTHCNFDISVIISMYIETVTKCILIV